MDWLVYFVGMDGWARSAKVSAETTDDAIDAACDELGILDTKSYIINVWPWSEVAV